MAWCGCRQSLFALGFPQEVFCPDQNKPQGNRNFLSICQEKRSGMTVKHELATEEKISWCVKGYDAMKYWSLVILLCFSCRFSFIFFNFIRTLCICLFLGAKVDYACSWLVVQNWWIPSQNGKPLLRIEALHGIVILSMPINRIERSVLMIPSDSWVVCLIISPSLLLRPVVGLRPPSKIPSFCHSTSRCLLHLSLFCPRRNSRRRSLA